MIGDSETDSNASKAANIPFVLIEGGYTEKKINEIYHDHLVKNFTGLENASTTNVNILIKTATSRIVKYNEFGDKLNDISIRNIIFSQNLYKRDYQFNRVTTINNCKLYYDSTIASDNIEIMKTRAIEKFPMYLKGIYRETETENFSI